MLRLEISKAMVKYIFALKLKDTPEEYKYALDLQPSQESNPEKLLNSEIRAHIRDSLQRQSSCKIDDNTNTEDYKRCQLHHQPSLAYKPHQTSGQSFSRQLVTN